MNTPECDSKSPLAGLKVIDLSRILAGPWSTQILADLGAEVIKIEAPDNGDDTRHWGPPWVRDTHGADTEDSAYFQCTNRGKQSVCIDFNDASDLQKLLKLINKADILVENFKVGGTKKYGLDYETLAAINPRLIYCSITGFGQSGPYAHRAGYDYMIQAMGGLMSITGEADGKPGAGPQKIGVALSDVMTGLYATIGILAAVNERHFSGKGQQIDLALFDVTAATLANQATNYLIGNQIPTRLGNAHPNIVPYQNFATADEPIVIAVGNDLQFQRLTSVLEENWLADDPRFITNEARVLHRNELIPIIASALLRKTRADWLMLMEQNNIAAGPINSIADVFNDPQIKAREMLIDVKRDDGLAMTLVGNPIKFSRTPVNYSSAPPKLGEHDSANLTDNW